MIWMWELSSTKYGGRNISAKRLFAKGALFNFNFGITICWKGSVFTLQIRKLRLKEKESL